jgi:2-polyprenyl-6-methoxyphenol hydroxylase-like FAD-dependent oxidoreductase
VVDATGRRAAFARSRTGPFEAIDRLVGFVRFFRESELRDPGTLVEAFADGWWYTAGLPGGLRLFACMTDADIGRRLRLADEAAWSRQLASTSHVSLLAVDATLDGPLLVRPSGSRCLESAAGENWLAVGDAASVFDPLSSQGIAKALRSGIFASYAIADLLAKGDASGLARYRRFVRDEFAGYLQVRSRYYREERRWPDSEFWRRRADRPLTPAAPIDPPSRDR